MKLRCPRAQCALALNQAVTNDHPNPPSSRIVRNGSFYRTSDSRWVDRFRCRNCRRSFSRATQSPAFGQKKRRINFPLRALLSSGISQRRAARLLRVNRKTIPRKLKFLAKCARHDQEQLLLKFKSSPLSQIQFDDLETSEHSKCKPLSVALAVEPKTRKILSFQVSQMPAKGRLVHLARRKYGLRRDERRRGWNRMFRELVPLVQKDATWTSDENPHYPWLLKRHHRDATHIQVPGQRGCIAGQGELKKIGFDPLFALNHSCAMLRANINRLFRRTWCTTKKREALLDHLSVYVAYHNRVLTPPYTA